MILLAKALLVCSIGSLLVSVGCGQGSPESAQAEPEQSQPQDPTTDPQSEGPEIIDQAEGERVNPVETNPDTEGQAGDASDDTDSAEAEPSNNPLIGLPGFTPSQGSAAGTPETGSAVLTGPLQVLVQATVYELTPSTPEDLAPIEQFLTGSPTQTLTPDALGAFGQLVATLNQAGVLRLVSSPRVLVPSGTGATIEITQLGGGQVGGLPTARSALQFSVSPTASVPADDTQPATVDTRFELKFAEAESAFQVVSQDLGLNLGPRARVAGAATVTDQHTFFFARRVVGGGEDRELLVLVRPQVMKADLTK